MRPVRLRRFLGGTVTYTLLFGTLLGMLFIGVAIDWRNHRQAKLDKEFQEWLARGIHPSLWGKDLTDGS